MFVKTKETAISKVMNGLYSFIMASTFPGTINHQRGLKYNSLLKSSNF